MSIIFKRKKKNRQNLDGEAGIVVDIMVKHFDDLNENLKSLLVARLADIDQRLTELEDKKIRIFCIK